jgi:hypothetical protein
MQKPGCLSFTWKFLVFLQMCITLSTFSLMRSSSYLNTDKYFLSSITTLPMLLLILICISVSEKRIFLGKIYKFAKHVDRREIPRLQFVIMGNTERIFFYVLPCDIL